MIDEDRQALPMAPSPDARSQATLKNRHLIRKCHPVAIDGTQKLARDGQWRNEEWLER